MPHNTHSSSDAELDLIRQLDRLYARLGNTSDIDNLLRATVRFAASHFDASEACVVVHSDDRSEFAVQFAVPKQSDWNLIELRGFLARNKTAPSPHQLLARLKRRQASWGVIVVRDQSHEYNWHDRRALSIIGNRLCDLIRSADLKRIREVRARIDRKIMEQLRPKDLFYQILHGLRSLTRYDHSASLALSDHSRSSLIIMAEQIAWKKGKSDRVGTKIPLPNATHPLFAHNNVYRFERTDSFEWTEPASPHALELAELLDLGLAPDAPSNEPIEHSLICAPFQLKDRRLGVLKIAAENPLTLTDYEASLVSEFVPYVMIALQNAQRAESLEQNVMAFERKSTMADLAKGVSHDINNSLGAVLPLVQQMRVDLESGTFDQETFEEDLVEIEQSLLLCRRVFGGMLRIAKGATPIPTEIMLAKEVETTLSVVGESFRRAGIAVETSLDPNQLIVGVQSDIQQLLVNFLGNARDATIDSGQVIVSVTGGDHHVHLMVKDDGAGIPEQQITKVCEPFYTTKKTGTGLGLAICQSIVSQMHGRLRIESQPDQGTEVHVYFPAIRDEE